MPATDPLTEFRTHWLPNVSDTGLSRLVSLLESQSPLLIRGAFVHAVPMGCLASHIAWNHPVTRNLDDAVTIGIPLQRRHDPGTRGEPSAELREVRFDRREIGLHSGRPGVVSGVALHLAGILHRLSAPATIRTSSALVDARTRVVQ